VWKSNEMGELSSYREAVLPILGADPSVEVK
jgi:hypothetical protein